MTDSCRDIREKIEDMLARELPAGETGAVERHVADCAGCRQYREGLESDDRRLNAFASSMDGLASRIQDGVLGAAAESTPAGRTGHGVGQTTEPASGRGVHLFDRPSVRVAVAASVIVAIAVISHFSNRTSPPDIIWANVFRQVEESTGCVSRGQVTEDGETLDFVRYESRMYGHKQELHRDGALVNQAFVQYSSRLVTLVHHDDSTYFQHTFGRRTINVFRKHSALTIVSRMKGREHKNLGISEVNGITVSGIEVADTVAYGDVRYVQMMRLYVDIETQWPVRIEAGNLAGRDVPASNLVIDEFQWYTEFRRDDFEPVIPDGFKRVDSFDSGASGPSASPEIVWDAVFEMIENPPGYIMRSQSLRNGRAALGRDIYYSPEYGTRTDVFRQDTLFSRYVFSVETSMTFRTNYRDRFHSSRSVMPKFVKSMMGYDPLLIIEKQLKKPRESIGVSEIDGVIVHGVEIDTYNHAHPDKQIGKVRIYVDADTEWPVRMEVEGKDSGRILRMDYRWHPEFTPAMFTPDVPGDFFVADLDDPIEDIIERGRVGLRSFANVTGRYPEGLWSSRLRTEIADRLEKMETEDRLSPGTADSLDAVLHAGVLSAWNDRETRERAMGEHTRYDPTVTPADSAGVLYRWRIDDKIGVIYGDLRFELADASQFAEADSVRLYLREEKIKRFIEADSLRIYREARKAKRLLEADSVRNDPDDDS